MNIISCIDYATIKGGGGMGHGRCCALVAVDGFCQNILFSRVTSTHATALSRERESRSTVER
jgi:hypothetical protein